MAFAMPLEDLGDQFCLCSICKEYFKEPKQLPCLHRFCKRCLNGALQVSRTCPLCRKKVELPRDGVEGFQTDFFCKELVEFVVSQKTGMKGVRKCCDCNKLLVAVAYCFRCNDFLCVKCYPLHGVSDTSNDHRQHTLSIESAKSKNITMEELDSFRDAPRCQSHHQNITELCCQTCNKLLICLLCTHGDHKDHKFQEIKIVANWEKGRLESKVQILENVAKDKLAVTPTEVIKRINENAEKVKGNFKKKYEEEVQKVKSEVNIVKQRIKEIKDEKDSIKQREFSTFEDEMHKLINEIRKRFENKMAQKEQEINEQYQSREDMTEKALNKLYMELERLNKIKDNFEESIENQLEFHLTSMPEIAMKFEETRKVLSELKFTASTIFASQSVWMAAIRTSDVCKKGDNLHKDFLSIPNLEKMSKLKVNDRHSRLLERKLTITVSDKELSVPFEAEEGPWFITDITGGDGTIVLTGEHSRKKQSIIVVFDQNGTMKGQVILKEKSTHHSRFCDVLSKFKVASVCQPNEIGIFDIRDSFYMYQNMSEISSWPPNRNVSCVAANRLNNSIFVGGESSREVYIFNDKLCHQQVLNLPELFKWPRDLTIYKNEVFLCDYDGQTALQATIDASTNIVVQTFKLAKPDLGETNWKPRSVCTDSDGFLYILWTTEKFFGRDRYILSQYSKSDQRLIDTKQLDTDARCLSVLETGRRDKLLVASCDTFDVYSLVDSR